MEDEITRKLNFDHIQQIYGLSETTFGCTIKIQGNTKPSTVVSLVPGMDAKVVNIYSDEALGVNEIGELCFRGPTIMKGYIKNAAETAQTIRSSWLYTGDIGYYDEDGDFFIVDRKKEIIKYKGFQVIMKIGTANFKHFLLVAPTELQALLLKHSEVTDAGVIGIPDQLVGELPKAFVVKQKDSKITSEELEKYISSKVSPHKWLRRGITFIDEIPRNPSGKILRRKLKKADVIMKS